MLSKKKQVKPEKAKKRDPRKAFSRIDLSAESQHVPGKPEKRSLILRRSGSAGVAKGSKDIQQILDCVERIMSTVDEPMVLLDSNLKVVSASRRFYSTFKLTTKKTEKESFWKLGNRQWDIPLLKEQLDGLLHKKTSLENLKLKQILSHLKERTMLVNARIIYSQMKKPELILLAIKDITERKEAEESLVESERKYKFLYEEGLSFNIIIGSDQLIKDANKTALNLLGYRKGEVIGKPALKFIRDEDKERVKGILSDALMGKITQENEIPVLAKDGSVHTILFSPGQLILREGGSSKGIVVTGVDITERKRAEEALREAKDHLEIRVKERTAELEQINRTLQEEIAERKRAEKAVETERQRFNDVLETLPAYLVLLSPDYHVSFANRFFRERFGESHGRCCYEYLFGRSEPCEICETYTVLKTKAPHRWEWTGPDGRNYDIYDFPFTDTDGSTLIMEMGIDITERKRAEEELRRHQVHLEELVHERTGELESRNAQLAAEITERKQAEEKLQNQAVMLANVSEAIIGFDPDMKINFWSPSAERLYGYTSSEALGRQATDLLRVVYLDITRDEAIDQLMKTGHLKVENIHHAKDGRALYVEYHATGIYNQQNKLTGIITIIHDVTERKKAEEELRQTRDYLENLFNYANAPIICWDSEFKITRFNHAFEHLTVYETEEVLGKDLSLLFPPESREESLDKIERTLSGEYWEVVEIPILRKNGDIRLVLWNSANIYAGDGKTILATIAQGQDITERKRAEEALRESEERLNRAQEIAHLGSWELDLLNNRLSWSDEAYRIFGLKPQEFGASYEAFLEAVHPADRKAVDAAYSGSLREGKDGYEIEHRIVRNADGEVSFVHEKCEHIRDSKGRIVRSVGMVQDITERKQAEEEIKALNEHLKQHETELAASNKELEAFIYSVSHDLRAPLRSIDGFSRALLEDYESKLDQTGKDYLRRVRGSAEHMRDLIDDLLNLSVAMRTEMRHERINLSELVKTIAAELQKTQPERRVEFFIQEGAFAHGDPPLLRTVLENFLGNAWKFTAKHPHSKIEFGVTKQNEQTVYFIRDDGAGFDMSLAEKLFVPFQRLHSTAEFSGNGIGLAIVSRIINRHGGRVWAEGEVEKGATFYFTL